MTKRDRSAASGTAGRYRLRRRWHLLLVGALLVVSGGCALDPTSSDGPTDTALTTSVRAPTGPAYQMVDHTFTLENRSGVRLRLTLALGPWLRGTDSAGLDNAWYQVSGQVGMPLTAGEYRNDRGSTPMDLDSATAAYLLGTVTFENLTPQRNPDDFLTVLDEPGEEDPDQHGPDSLLITLDAWGFPEPDRSSSAAYAESLNGALFACYLDRCFHTRGDSIKFSIAAAFDGDQTSGPHPFVVAVPKVFGPENPDGSPLFPGYVFRVDTLGFVVDGRIDPHEDPRSPDLSTAIQTEIGW